MVSAAKRGHQASNTGTFGGQNRLLCKSVEITTGRDDTRRLSKAMLLAAAGPKSMRLQIAQVGSTGPAIEHSHSQYQNCLYTIQGTRSDFETLFQQPKLANTVLCIHFKSPNVNIICLYLRPSLDASLSEAKPRSPLNTGAPGLRAVATLLSF